MKRDIKRQRKIYHVQNLLAEMRTMTILRQAAQTDSDWNFWENAIVENQAKIMAEVGLA